MENLRSLEALRVSPLTDVVLDLDTAVAQLNERTKAVFLANVDFFKERVDRRTPDYEGLMLRVSKLKGKFDEILEPGGFSITKTELEFVYAAMARRPYKDVIRFFVNDAFKKFFRDSNSGPRPSGPICVGYLLDLLRIIDPKVASFDDGVQIITEIMGEKESQLPPTLLGSMIDDTMKLAGTLDFPFDFLADKEGAQALKDSYLHFANDNEKKGFERGFTITRAEVLRIVGFH